MKKMFRFIGMFCLFSGCFFVNSAEASSATALKKQPPSIFVDKGACPFECCTYRTWLADKDIKIYSEIKGKKNLDTVKKGYTVKALTGEVHTKPTPMKVVYKHKKYAVGDTVYLLNYLGEGYQKVWFQGKVENEDISFLYNSPLTNNEKNCAKPGPTCWGRITGKQSSTWWAQVQLPSGKKGWTNKGKDFSNIDACSITNAEIQAMQKKDFTDYCKLINCKHDDCGCKKITSGWKVTEYCHGAYWKYEIEKNDRKIICSGENSHKGPIEKNCLVSKKGAQPLKCKD